MSEIEKRIEIVTTVASLIEPGKKYLLHVDKRSLSRNDAQLINKQLRKWGADGITVLYDGEPLKITEVN